MVAEEFAGHIVQTAFAIPSKRPPGIGREFCDKVKCNILLKGISTSRMRAAGCFNG